MEKPKTGPLYGQWKREGDEVVFLPTGFKRPMNYNERKFYAEVDRQEARKQRKKEEIEKARVEKAMAREIVPQENAQDRFKRGHSQVRSADESAQEKRKKLDGSIPYEMMPEEAAKAKHQAELMDKVAEICKEDEEMKKILRETDPEFREKERLEKERLEKEKEQEEKEKIEKQRKKEADEAYWNDPEVLKMTGRIVATKRGIKMSQDDITRLSQLHVSAKRAKLRGEIEKQQNVRSLKLGLGIRGIRIHLAHDDGWAWWKELVEGFPCLEDRDGGYAYRFLKPGESLFRHFKMFVPDIDLLDDEAAPGLFKEEVNVCNTSLREVDWEARKIGVSLSGSRQVVVMKLSLPSSAVQAVLDEHKGQLLYGMELQRIYPFRPKRLHPAAGRGGHGGGPEGAHPAGDRMDEDELATEELDELFEGEPMDQDQMATGEDKVESEKEKIKK